MSRRAFTVVGYWSLGGDRIPTGIIEGEHEVAAWDECKQGGPFSVIVQEDNATAAGWLVHQTNEEIA